MLQQLSSETPTPSILEKNLRYTSNLYCNDGFGGFDGFGGSEEHLALLLLVL